MKKKLVEMTVLGCVIGAVCLQPAKAQNPQGKHEYSVCSLLKNAKALDGHGIVLKGNLVATMESVRVEDDKCTSKIYISFEFENKGAEWQDWAKAVTDQISMRNLRPVEVTVEGIFHRHVGHRPNAVAQLELQLVLGVTYLTSPPPTSAVLRLNRTSK